MSRLLDSTFCTVDHTLLVGGKNRFVPSLLSQLLVRVFDKWDYWRQTSRDTSFQSRAS